jgi:DNA-binding response OmpR family regulator
MKESVVTSSGIKSSLSSFSSENKFTPHQVLVVDDSDDILTIIGYAFELVGYTCQCSHNLEEMNLSLANSIPDLIVLDLMLPGVNGYHVIDQLHHNLHTQTIPIIVITARTEEVYRRISTDLGVAYHLTKPFHPDELIAYAQVLLESN